MVAVPRRHLGTRARDSRTVVISPGSIRRGILPCGSWARTTCERTDLAAGGARFTNSATGQPMGEVSTRAGRRRRRCSASPVSGVPAHVRDPVRRAAPAMRGRGAQRVDRGPHHRGTGARFGWPPGAGCDITLPPTMRTLPTPPSADRSDATAAVSTPRPQHAPHAPPRARPPAHPPTSPTDDTRPTPATDPPHDSDPCHRGTTFSLPATEKRDVLLSVHALAGRRSVSSDVVCIV
jgi:hypothetical protein